MNNANNSINVCLIESPPFVYKDELGNFRGIEYDVFNSFATISNSSRLERPSGKIISAPASM